MLLFVFFFFREEGKCPTLSQPPKKQKTSTSFTHRGQLSMAGFFIPSANLLKPKTFKNYLGSADRGEFFSAAWMTIFSTKSQVNEQSPTSEAYSFS